MEELRTLSEESESNQKTEENDDNKIMETTLKAQNYIPKCNFNFYIEERYQHYLLNNDHLKIIDLCLIHGKETKKEGILTWLSIEDTCKFCGESNETNYYCS